MPETTRTVNVGLIGLGTVGGGTALTIARNRDEYLRAFGVDLRVTKACALEPERAAELGIAPEAFTTDWHDVVADPAVDIVVELIGGEHPAIEIFEAAFEAGKHVVTANKALLGRNMERLCGLAREAGVQLRCEASAGGGIPIVAALERSLVGNRMLTIAGILNGTTNYILSRMTAEGSSFADVLADAQRLGYAEADPSADVDGFDAASKVAILSSIAFHTRVTTDDVYMQGIRDISPVDIDEARKMGCVIKLLGIARMTDAGIDARVHPTMIPERHMLASVNGAMNAVFAVGDSVGETMFYGAGAGSFPTASAVVGDILELARAISRGEAPEAEAEPYERRFEIRPIENLRCRYYLRLTTTHTNDALPAVADTLEAFKIGVAEARQVVQDGGRCIIVLTEEARERDIQAACAELAKLPTIERVASLIRIEDTAAWTEGAEANE